MAAVTLALTEQPQNATVYNNRNALMQVTADGGTLGYTYQWQYARSTSGFKDIEGATNALLEIKKTDSFAKNAYYYRCVVTDSTGHVVTSDAAQLTVANAKFNERTAKQNLLKYYESRKSLDYAGEAFALAQAGVDVSDYADTIQSYYGYYPTNNSSTAANTLYYLYLDAYARNLNITDYLITGTANAQKKNMISAALLMQRAEDGYLTPSSSYHQEADAVGGVLALEMYFNGAATWGNEQKDTKLGRDGAIAYLLSNLKDYPGGGSVLSMRSSFAAKNQSFQTAQANLVLLLARLTDDPTWGKQAKAAMADVLQAMENILDSGYVTQTRSAAHFVSAFIAAAEQSGALKRNHYLNLAEGLMHEIATNAGAADGTFMKAIGTMGMSGDPEASVAVLLALTDYDNAAASYVTYSYPMSDSQAVSIDAASLKIDDLVVADVVLPTEGRFGSTITWESLQ